MSLKDNCFICSLIPWISGYNFPLGDEILWNATANLSGISGH